MAKLGKTFKSWTTPAFSERMLMKGAWKVAKGALKFAIRRPILTAAATLTHGAKGKRWKKRRAWFNTPLAGQNLTKWYK